jgi:transporter family protein
MADWIGFAMLAIVLWGVVGLLQKLGASHVSSHSLIVWVTAGFILLLPWFLVSTRLSALRPIDLAIGVGVGVINGLGSWFLFAALERGAKATVAIPLTALYPLVTVVLAVTFLGETLTPKQWAGLALAIVAAGLLSYETPDAA